MPGWKSKGCQLSIGESQMGQMEPQIPQMMFYWQIVFER